MTAINMMEMMRHERQKAKQKRAVVHKYELPGCLDDMCQFTLPSERLNTIIYVPNFLSQRDEENLCKYVRLF